MTSAGEVTVIIPQWNRAELLAILLKHLSLQTYPIHRTIVVDNGSTDNSSAVAKAFGSQVISLTNNHGFAFAVNRGIEAATTEWIAILNNDVTLEQTWLQEILTEASARGAWFGVGKLLSSVTGRIDGTFDLISAGSTAWRCGSDRPDVPLWSKTRPIQLAPMTAAIFRRELFTRVGLLDERFGSYLEDVDLGLRCSAAGLAGVYVPAARGTHMGSATRGAWHKATVQQISRNQIFISSKHFRGAPLWKILVAQLLWGLVALRHRTAGAWLAGKWQGLRQGSAIRGEEGSWGRIRESVERSEREIYEFQRSAGFDSYWRWYFMLTGGTR